MLLYIILYFLVPIIIVSVLLVANMEKKWLTRNDAENLEPEPVIFAIFAFILWPISIVIFGIFNTARLIKNHALPKD